VVAFSDGKPVSTFPENALVFAWSHFLTENRCPLFLKMLWRLSGDGELLLALRENDAADAKRGAQLLGRHDQRQRRASRAAFGHRFPNARGA
jgi:hypothetical protein